MIEADPQATGKRREVATLRRNPAIPRYRTAGAASRSSAVIAVGRATSQVRAL
jgi:hypothetical protein